MNEISTVMEVINCQYIALNRFVYQASQCL